MHSICYAFIIFVVFIGLAASLQSALQLPLSYTEACVSFLGDIFDFALYLDGDPFKHPPFGLIALCSSWHRCSLPSSRLCRDWYVIPTPVKYLDFVYALNLVVGTDSRLVMTLELVVARERVQWLMPNKQNDDSACMWSAALCNRCTMERRNVKP